MSTERMPNILIVDDTRANLKLLTDMLQGQHYRVRPVLSGKAALASALAEPPDLVLLDINMPEMNGYEVCDRIKAEVLLREVPVIFISALGEVDDKVRAFQHGGLDYITKPFRLEEVLVRVRTHLRIRALQLELRRHNEHLQELVDEKVREVSEAQMAMLFALAKLAESRDTDTGQHVERTQTFCRILAEELSMNSPYAAEIDAKFIDNIYHAAPLHDIGKVGVPDAILLKPGKLTPEEWETMMAHTSHGARTLRAVYERYRGNAFIALGMEIALSHHEKWDGTGYPEKLSGLDIPLSARIMAVADVYDALRAERCYKKSFSHEESRRIIVEGSGAHFEPALVDAFLAREEEFSSVWTRMRC
jgi:putative two-component system response regulator